MVEVLQTVIVVSPVNIRNVMTGSCTGPEMRDDAGQSVAVLSLLFLWARHLTGPGTVQTGLTLPSGLSYYGGLHLPLGGELQSFHHVRVLLCLALGTMKTFFP